MRNSTISKRDVYQIVTDQVLDLMERGEIPWNAPWRRGSNEHPKNFTNQKKYRGVNVFLLHMRAYFEGYELPYWLTYKQAQALGGQVKKGEKSQIVVFWKQWEKETTNESGETEKDTIPVLRYYNVFNVCQCEGLDLPTLPDAAPLDFNPIDACETIIGNYPHPPAIFHNGGGRAYYDPALDSVHLPERERFKSVEGYYSTMFHELGHSTGHQSRLSRKGIDQPTHFGSYDYGQEELVAEMASAFLCGYAGIERQTIENHAAYLDNWRKAIKGNKKMVVMAAAQAQKAADYILAVKASQEAAA